MSMSSQVTFFRWILQPMACKSSPRTTMAGIRQLQTPCSFLLASGPAVYEIGAAKPFRIPHRTDPHRRDLHQE